jgi:hypothetical protein
VTGTVIELKDLGVGLQEVTIRYEHEMHVFGAKVIVPNTIGLGLHDLVQVSLEVV